MNRSTVFVLVVLAWLNPSFGDQRVPWTNSRINGSPEPARPFLLERVFPNLKFERPVDLVYEPTTDRYFMVELNGRIVSFPNDPNADSVDLALNVRQLHPRSRQTFSIVFHPRFADNRYIYVCYRAVGSGPNGTRVSRFKVTRTDPPQLDAASEQVVLTWHAGGHNGCKLLFGPDDMLYISTGDAAPPSPPDTFKTGQDISDLLASVLRIDVDRHEGDRAYAIPKDNPFVTLDGAAPEVWSYGFRNPWRMSFDSETGDLWVGDVGWELWELIFRVQRGGNYGWSIVEGSQPVHPNGKRGPTPIQPPIVQHPHTESMSITGGYVYRGERLKSLHGHYIYGDYITGRIWSLSVDQLDAPKPVEIASTPLQIITFSETPDRDLLVVDYDGGIYRLVRNQDSNRSTTFPHKLSETGLFESAKDHHVAPGVIAYDMNAEMWSDHARATRFIAIPNQGVIREFQKHNAYKGWLRGRWEYPAGTVFAKTYSMETTKGTTPTKPTTQRRLETQILHLDDETWRGYTYVWNDEQTDAHLADKQGLDLDLTVQDDNAPNGIRHHTWHVPSRAECMMCHNPKSGIILGFRPEALHDKTGNSELSRLQSLDLFASNAVPKRTMARPHDSNADINNRARTWLHTNCAHCHRRGGGGTTAIDLRWEIPFNKTDLVSTLPTQGNFNIPNARLVAPGDPYRSLLLYRIATTGVGHMPHMGAKMIDVPATRLIHDWIAQLPSDRPVPPLTNVDQGQVAPLLQSTHGALKLLHGIHADVLNPDVRDLAIRLGAAHDDVQISGLFQRFISPDQRRRTLGLNINPESILSLKGDPRRGERVMKQGGAATCLSCHRVRDEGREMGPDLTGIGGKYTRADVLTHILEPSKVIDEPFATWILTTTNDETITGFMVEREPSHVTLKLFTGTTKTIKTKSIDTIKRFGLSAMPKHLIQGLTAQEAADLVDYLISLKK